MIKISPSEITPEHVFLSRRQFMVGAGSLAVGAVALSACGGASSSSGGPAPVGQAAPASVISDLPAALAHAEAYASKEK